MKTRRTDWTTIIASFLVGFDGNATLWRLIQHRTEDVIFPAFIATISLIVLVVHIAERVEE